MTTPLLVIHDAGDADAASRWRPLVEAWPGPALAPDLPGHGEAPPPVGATYAASDAAIAAYRAQQEAGLGGERPVLVGHGWGGFAAELLAAAGWAAKVVLVDGLGGPWRDVHGLVADTHRWLRGVLADQKAIDPPTETPDPRLAHGFPSVWEPRFVAGLRGAITVPVIAVETPASQTPPAERQERVALFGGGARLISCEAAAGSTVADALRATGWIQS